MSTIKVITASAGSGKTTRLARVLQDSVVSGEVRPDAVVATTFTRKAAAELQDRARRVLLAAGRVDDAQRLMAARIGTVNSVCDRLVSQFAFELGLPPRLAVLDDTLAAEHLNRALTTTAPAELLHELEQLKARMPVFEWRRDVRQVVEAARTNGIDGEALGQCAERSVASLLELFGSPATDADTLDAALEAALVQLLATAPMPGDTTKKTREALDDARKALSHLRSGAGLSWADWARLSTLELAKKSGDLAAPLNVAAAAHDRHPRLRMDLERGIRSVFELARLTLDAYQERKRSWGVVDFVDQEVHALALLERESVRERLRGELDLVLVDEFQDTSPLQLAIFLELARIAPRSIWVGDQKQSIFGFRGTDPSLMNAALEDLLKDEGPPLSGTDSRPVNETVDAMLSAAPTETLEKSWRSRPELVRLTSDIFVAAFGHHGLPPERVRLEPGIEQEPDGLGNIVEYWPLELADKRRTTDRDKAVAAGVRELLASGDERVRDRQGSETRPLGAADIAVLCRTNAQCNRVATALEALDIRAVVPRLGLFDTVEGWVTLAALRLWIDPRDRLAAAELARIVDHPTDADAWLARVLDAAGERAVVQTEPLLRLVRARDAQPTAGVLEALDAALTAIDLPRLCRAWGDDAARLANLDAIRAHAHRYLADAEARGLPATVSGLLDFFGRLTEEHVPNTREDQQALRSGDDAVTVSTWHRAKGLEWPVTVLFGLEKERDDDALGVEVVSDRERIDLDDPLRDRWIRYWFTPFQDCPRDIPFTDRLERCAATRRRREERKRELLRLLYVGWTRARDRLVFAAQENKELGGILGLLREIDAGLIDTPTPRSTWAGRSFDVTIRPCQPADPVTPAPVIVEEYRRPDGPVEHPPAYMSPSSRPAEGEPTVGTPEPIGERLPLAGAPIWQHLGKAVHGFFAADSHEAPEAERIAMAARLLTDWGVADALQPAHLLQASSTLHTWVDARWPDARWVAEWPLLHRLPTGTVVRGAPDLVLELADRLVVVDHKSFPGDAKAAAERAVQYAPQLAAYAAGLSAATGKPVQGCYLHLPVSGLVISVG